MSTKIYNGIKFKSKDISKIQSNLNSLTEPALNVAAKIIGNISEIEWYVNHLKKEIKDELTSKNKIWKQLISDHNKLFTSFRIPKLNFSVFIYAHKKDEIYGYWAGNNEYYKILKPYVTDFHYQNQTDKQENISEKEWRYREKVWSKHIKFWVSENALEKKIIDMNIIDSIDVKERKVQNAFYNALDCLGYKRL